jgi:hypothetical protein
MRRILQSFLLPGTLIFYAACNPSSEKKETKPLQITGKFNKIDLGSCDTTGKGGVTLKVHVWEPSGTDSAAAVIRDFLKTKIINRINDNADLSGIGSKRLAKANESITSAYMLFDSSYVNFKSKFPEAPGCWEIELKGDTVLVSPKIMQYQMDHYAYLGGAHPNTFRTYYVFDTKTGKERKSDVFVTDTLALLKKVEKAFRKTENLADTTNLENAGYFLSDHKFFISVNYAFTRQGIFFYYNPYEIAPYARGAITFTIPYSELEGIVKKEQIF